MKVKLLKLIRSKYDYIIVKTDFPTVEFFEKNGTGNYDVLLSSVANYKGTPFFSQWAYFIGNNFAPFKVRNKHILKFERTREERRLRIKKRELSTIHSKG